VEFNEGWATPTDSTGLVAIKVWQRCIFVTPCDRSGAQNISKSSSQHGILFREPRMGHGIFPGRPGETERNCQFDLYHILLVVTIY